MVYHFLDESEPFSEKTGGAIQRIVANLLRGDEDSRVVCSTFDETWSFPIHQIVKLSLLRGRTRWRGIFHYPSFVQRALLKGWFDPLEKLLKPGDVLWIHNRPDAINALAPMALRSGAKLVLHMHNSFSKYRPAVSYMKSFAATEKIVFVSSYLEREARERFVTLGHTVVMHNGADSAIFHPGPLPAGREIPVVSFVGRIVPVKGAHVLIDAMKLLKQRGVKLHARLIGASFFGGAVAGYMRKLRDNAPDNVTFQGYATGTGLADEYRDSDFFCCPSVWNDPFPTVNLEAMGCGLACVATAVGGIPEQFAEGGALMVPPNNPVALADALQQLATNRELRAQLAAKSVANFDRNFSWTVASQRYQAILKTI